MILNLSSLVPRNHAKYLQNSHTGDHIRKFVLSSYRVYTTLVSDCIAASQNQEFQLSNPKSELIYQSCILYRQKFQILLQDIDSTCDLLQNSAEETEIEPYLRLHDTLTFIDKVLYLCEIIFLNPTDSSISLELIKWLQDTTRELSVLAYRFDIILDTVSTTPIDASSDYWPLIHDSLSHGQLDIIYRLLIMHPRIIKLKHQYPDLIEELRALLHNHPFSTYISEALDSASQSEEEIFNTRKHFESNSKYFSLKLHEWQTRMQQLQQALSAAGHTIGALIPELIDIFDIFIGDQDSIRIFCQNSCSRYLSLLFLYKDPPPLTRNDILYRLESVFELFPVHGTSGTRPFQSNQIYATNDANDGLNLSLRLLLIDCLHGDVGNIIKTLYELSTVGLSCVSYSLDSKERQKNAILGCVSIVAMQTCVHLADLLTRSSVAPDLLRAIQCGSSDDVDTSVTEELTLQLAHMLDDFSYPPELIKDYLCSTSIRGHDWAGAILNKIKCSTDHDVHRLAALLQQIDNDQAPASAVYKARAMHWYNCGDRRGIAKAVRYFELAGDSKRVIAVVDRALWALCCGVRSCDELFPGLLLHVSQPTLPIVGYSITPLTRRNSVDDMHDRQLNQHINERVKERFIVDDLSKFWDRKYWPDHYIGSDGWNKQFAQTSSSTSTTLANTKISTLTSSNRITDSNSDSDKTRCDSEELKSALSFAEGVVGSLYNLSSEKENYATSLTSYTDAIVLTLTSLEIFEQLQQMSQSRVETSSSFRSSIAANGTSVVNTTSMAPTELEVAHSVQCMDGLRVAANLVHALLESHIVPMRYWLHMIEMTLWIDQKAKTILPLLRTIEQTALTQRQTSAIVNASLNTPILTKLQAYSLSHCLTQLETSYNSAYLLEHVSSDDLKKVRLELVGLVSSTIIQESADLGRQVLKVRAQEKEYDMQRHNTLDAQADLDLLAHYSFLSCSGPFNTF